ncbi:uncharacterized protein [Argopecten irradians]|uniref:uncharacterized protein n=1 Tax=Argopecten irradians TaxID=31199 RepID=UPI003715390D
MECKECILQVGTDQFVVSMETVFKTFGSKIEMFLDATSEKNTKYVIRRPKDSTMALIQYCYTGKLHIPQSVCRGEFLTELQFWGLKHGLLESCCYHKLCSYLNDQKKLEGFEKMQAKSENRKTGRILGMKECIWGIVDCDRKSKYSKVYFYVSTCMVLLLIAVLALTSMNQAQDNNPLNTTSPIRTTTETSTSSSGSPSTSGSNNYRLPCPKKSDCMTRTTPTPQVVTYTPMSIKVNCVSCSLFTSSLSPSRKAIENKVQNTEVQLYIPKCCRAIVKMPMARPPKAIRVDAPISDQDYQNNGTSDNTSKGANQFPIAASNGSTGVVQNVANNKKIKIGNLTDPRTKSFGTNIMTMYQITKNKLSSFTSTLRQTNVAGQEFIVYHSIEDIITVFFTLEFVIRILTCPNKKEFFSRLLNWLDLVLLFGSFGRILLENWRHLLEDSIVVYDLLLYLQMFRVFRLLRTIENIRAFKVLRYSLVTGMKDIGVLVMYVLVTMCIFSNFIYFVENKSDFPSIPAAWWWSIVTMTTVGYGDMVPKTVLGKLIGCICALSGVVLFSLIIPVFVSTFLTAYEYANGSPDDDHIKSESARITPLEESPDKNVKTWHCPKVLFSKHQEQGSACRVFVKPQLPPY